MPTRPIVAAIGCGGTISSLGRDSTDVLDYPDFGTKMSIEEVVGRYPEIAKVAEVVPVPFRSVGSTAIGPPEWLELASIIHRLAAERPELAGFVIPHGTATLEETAYFLHLALKTDKNVVAVGAQRPASALSSDAGMNLLGAVRVACAPQSRGLGVLGHVDGDGVQIYRRPVRLHAPATEFDLGTLQSLPRVDITYSYGGVDGTVVEALVAAGARGIVSAGLAPGIPALLERAALEKARDAGVVIVQSSRAGSGRVALRRYLEEGGMVAADNLNPQKARILLMLALTRSPDIAEIRRIFATY